MKSFNSVRIRQFLALCVVPLVVLLSSCEKPAAPVEFVAPIDDGVFNSVQYKGEVIYLDFWASWCVPCRESFPWMNDMLDKYSEQGLQVIGVSLDHDKALAKRFAEEFKARFTVGYDVDGTLANQFEVKGLPASVLINREGRVVATHTGFNADSAVKYEESILKALQ